MSDEPKPAPIDAAVEALVDEIAKSLKRSLNINEPNSQPNSQPKPQENEPTIKPDQCLHNNQLIARFRDGELVGYFVTAKKDLNTGHFVTPAGTIAALNDLAANEQNERYFLCELQENLKEGIYLTQALPTVIQTAEKYHKEMFNI